MKKSPVQRRITAVVFHASPAAASECLLADPVANSSLMITRFILNIYARMSNIWWIVLWPFTSSKTPTNQIMLCYRTLGRALLESDASEDDIAPMFRDALMPFRSLIYRYCPAFLFIYRFFVQSLLFGCPGIIDFVTHRTRWLDQVTRQAISERGIRQVVVIASGYSTYAYRILDPNVKFFEIDLPKSIDVKKALVNQLNLPSKGGVHFIAADLSQVSLEKALGGTAFDPKEKSLYLIEGLTYYLPREALDLLLQSISAISRPGSMLAFDYLDHAVYRNRSFALGYQALRLIVANRGEPLKSGMSIIPHKMKKRLASSSSVSSIIYEPIILLNSLQMSMVTQKDKDKGKGKIPITLPSFFHYCLAEGTERNRS